MKDEDHESFGAMIHRGLCEKKVASEVRNLDASDRLDGSLFRYWAMSIAQYPSEVAKAISRCVTINDFRVALTALAREKSVRLQTPPSKSLTLEEEVDFLRKEVALFKATSENRLLIAERLVDEALSANSRIYTESANQINELHSHVATLREALEWYKENARLCRLIHSEGDKGRHALSNDGGKRAEEVLALLKASNEEVKN